MTYLGETLGLNSVSRYIIKQVENKDNGTNGKKCCKSIYVI
jgi:hypothetical protein